MAVRHRTVRDRTAPAGGRPAAPELAPPLPDRADRASRRPGRGPRPERGAARRRPGPRGRDGPRDVALRRARRRVARCSAGSARSSTGRAAATGSPPRPESPRRTVRRSRSSGWCAGPGPRTRGCACWSVRRVGSASRPRTPRRRPPRRCCSAACSAGGSSRCSSRRWRCPGWSSACTTRRTSRPAPCSEPPSPPPPRAARRFTAEVPTMTDIEVPAGAGRADPHTARGRPGRAEDHAPAAVGEERPGLRRAVRRRRPARARGSCRTCSLRSLAFSLAASGIYLVNDAKDVARTGRTPPSGSGRSRPGWCRPDWRSRSRWCCSLAAVAVSLLASAQLVIVLAVYVVVQLAYCFWLKHQAVLDICIVASGFLLRAIAGRRGDRDPAVAVVPAGGGVRVAVHGGRQAVRRDDAGRADRARRSARRWRTTRPATCGSCGRCRRRC